jgi:hypothetical protein
MLGIAVYVAALRAAPEPANIGRMKQRGLGIVGLLIVASPLAISACTSGGSGGGLAAPSGACRDLISALCNKIAACNPLSLREDFGDVAGCIEREGFACASLSLPGASWSSDQMTQCTQQIATSTNCLDDTLDQGACKTPPGTLPDGVSCEQSSQCAGGQCNREVAVSVDGGFKTPACGTCATPDGGVSSAKCGSGPACVSPERCVYDSAAMTSRCTPPGAEGSPCTSSSACASGLTCKGTMADAGTRFCARPGASGAVCASSSDCNGQQGLRCVAGLCGPPAFVPLGDACDGQAQICEVGAVCNRSQPTATTSVCVARVADGAPCNTSAGLYCRDPASCRDGVCRLPGTAQCN